MIGEEVILRLAIPPGDVYSRLQLLLPTIHIRTRVAARR